MNDPATVLVSCRAPEEIVRARNEAAQKLSPEMRKAFGAVFSNYLARFDIEGVYRRFNNRTVAQIFAEYDAGEAKIVEKSELDGVRYTLYEAPPKSDDKPRE